MDSSIVFAVIMILIAIFSIVEFGYALKRYINKEGRYSESDDQ